MASMVQLKSGIGSALSASIKSESLINRRGSQASVRDQLGQQEKFVHAAICCAVADELANSGTTAAMWGVASAVAWGPIDSIWKPTTGTGKMVQRLLREALSPGKLAERAFSQDEGRLGRYIDKRLHTRYDCWVAVDWLMVHDGGKNVALVCNGIASKTVGSGSRTKQAEEYGTVIIYAEVNGDGIPQKMHASFLKFAGDEYMFEDVEPEKEEESSWFWPF